MKEEMKNQEINAEKARKTTPDTPESLIRGTMILKNPMRAESTDITELKYDFSKLTGWEYVEAMDSDANARNVFKITTKQALCLFAMSAGKETPKIDATDIKQQISVVDAVKAVQLATVFLVTSTRDAKMSSSEK